MLGSYFWNNGRGQLLIDVSAWAKVQMRPYARDNSTDFIKQ